MGSASGVAGHVLITAAERPWHLADAELEREFAYEAARGFRWVCMECGRTSSNRLVWTGDANDPRVKRQRHVWARCCIYNAIHWPMGRTHYELSGRAVPMYPEPPRAPEARALDLGLWTYGNPGPEVP